MAIGCGVSFAVGVLFWPRGVSSVVGDDLADAFRSGAAFLTQAVDWALSELMVPPAASVAAVSAGIRLDDAVRGFLTEQGSKRLSKDDLWALVNSATRLRLTAHTLAGAAAGLPTAATPRSASSRGAPACRWPGRTGTRARRPAPGCGSRQRISPGSTERSPTR